jgi:hypothetical protein
VKFILKNTKQHKLSLPAPLAYLTSLIAIMSLCSTSFDFTTIAFNSFVQYVRSIVYSGFLQKTTHQALILNNRDELLTSTSAAACATAGFFLGGIKIRIIFRQMQSSKIHVRTVWVHVPSYMYMMKQFDDI